MKNNLKKAILEQRNSMPNHEVTDKSDKIKNNLFNLQQYKISKIMMFFVSYNSEVFTHEMIKEALKTKKIIVPKIEHNQIEPSLILDFDNLVPSGKFGILEPIEAMKISYKNIDLILVPGIVFDLQGLRIGYGLGFYDKFLRLVPKAIKIGLAFDFQVVDEIPQEEHDVPVDIIVTEERVIDCRKKWII